MTDAEKLRDALAFYRSQEGVTLYSDKRRRIVLDAAEAHLSTLPKTKMVEVWHLEAVVRSHDGTWTPVVYCYLTGEQAALALDEEATVFKHLEEALQCFRITGPHTQEVPA